MVRRRLLLVTVALAACDPTIPLEGSSDAPYAYVMLQPGPTAVLHRAVDSTLHAIVGTVGTPSSTYWRAIEEFTMTRRSDGAAFDWVITPREGPFDIDLAHHPAFPPTGWNVHLAWTGTGGRLGRRDLAPGETYDLLIRTEGRTITGTTTIPGAPMITRVSDGNHHVYTWESAPNGAWFYIEEVAGQTSLYYGSERRWEITMYPDTAANWSPEGWIRLRSQNAEIAAYATDYDLASSGLVGAYGTFGAFTIDSFIVPAYQPALRAAVRERAP